jgi:hypothetical protein
MTSVLSVVPKAAITSPFFPVTQKNGICSSMTEKLRVSRKLNNLFTLTAIAVHDGDFMKFGPGISAVTLSGGQTYHRILSAREGQHAIRWFIHDPSAFFDQGDKFQILRAWIDATLTGLNHVNPFIQKLKHLEASDPDTNLALQIEHSDTNTSNEIAAIISLAPDLADELAKTACPA